MKKKIFNIIAILALVASFALPALAPQNVWADTTLETFCASKGMSYSYGKCVLKSVSKARCDSISGATFTAYYSNALEGVGDCTIGITSGGGSTADTPSSNPNNEDPDNPDGGGTSPSSGSSKATASGTESDPSQMNKQCGEGEVYTSIIGGGGCVSIEENGGNIFNILNIILTVLTYGVGIAGTLGIVISGIQYLTARDNEQQMVKAKSRLINIIIGLAAYAFMWAFLQWLIPGGLLSGGN